MSLDQLVHCIRSGDDRAALRLLEKDPALAKAQVPGPCGPTTPLHLAAEHRRLEVCRRLLDAGANPSARDGGDVATPLHWAAHADTPEIVSRLVDAGADPNDASDAHGAGPLGWAVCLSADSREAARRLLGLGAEMTVFAAVALGETAALRAMIGRDPAVLEATQSEFEQSRGPLHLAALKDRADVVDVLLELGADRDGRDDEGRTAIDGALAHGRRAAYDRLLARGATPDPELLAEVGSVDRAGRLRALHDAITRGDPVAAGTLLDEDPGLAGAVFPASLADEGCTPLHLAAWEGWPEIAERLLDLGAELDRRDASYDATPLGWAIENDRPEMMDLLLRRGSAYELVQAAAMGRTDLLERRLRGDPGELATSRGYEGLLHTAILHGRLDAVRWLVAKGANIEWRNRSDLTAAELAGRCARGEVGPHGGMRPRAEHAAILSHLSGRAGG
jgi:ankyrin repeat protein